MRKILAFLPVMAFAISITACGGGGGKTTSRGGKTSSKFRVQVLETSPGGGAWILNGTRISKHMGEKVIMFVGMGVAEDQQAARDLAKLNAQASAASAIKTLATRQVARAWERVGIPGRTEQGEQVTRGLEAAVSRNVDVSGLNPVRHYYRYVKKPGFARPFYEWYTEMAMPYNRYKDLRDGVIRRNQRSYRLNRRQRVLYNRTERALRELNRMDREGNGGVPGGKVELSPTQKQKREQAVPGQ